jgi:hypothetical protein
MSLSHVFISYSHGDKVHLDRLLTWLDESGFAEHERWFDQHIDGGNNWRDEIAAALDEAYVVLVIVTATSVKSLYCTYEWAYALGQGIPILPLVFDNVSIADVPSPLAVIQFTDCTGQIPDYLKEQIRHLRSVPPQVAAINRIVYDAIYDTHRRFFILGWIGDGLNTFDEESRREVTNYFAQKASEAQKTLQALMIDKAFAFSGKQYRLCWRLIDFLKGFAQLRDAVEDGLHHHLFAQFDSEWLPAFEYFEGNGWWREWKRRYFERNLEDEHNRMEVFAEMMRAFPIFLVSDADILIQNVRLDQQRNQRS